MDQGDHRLGHFPDGALQLFHGQANQTAAVVLAFVGALVAAGAEGFFAGAGQDNRADFLSQMKNFDEARFTDYESDSVELDQEKQTATIRVVYTLYLPSSPYETEVAEIQEWSRDGISNGWTVVSSFESRPAVASN